MQHLYDGFISSYDKRYHLGLFRCPLSEATLKVFAVDSFTSDICQPSSQLIVVSALINSSINSFDINRSLDEMSSFINDR